MPVRNTTAIQDGDDIGLGSLLFKFDVELNGRWEPGRGDMGSARGGTRILENVPEADQIEPLLPSGLGKDATRLMVKRLRLLSKFAAALGNVMEAEKLSPGAGKLLHAFPTPSAAASCSATRTAQTYTPPLPWPAREPSARSQ